MPPPLTAGIHDFFPPEGLAETFLVAMAKTRVTFLTPNDTTGLADFNEEPTKEDLTTAVSCDTDMLLATAIAARFSRTPLSWSKLSTEALRCNNRVPEVGRVTAI